ncbi:hypothetical protein CCL07_08870 [Pseudomonas congelans]|nr:hypothetical protein CCL07_08870 [Pseudomonas congelans]
MSAAGLGGGMIFASLVKLAVPEECIALKAWHAKMQERPSIQTWRPLVAQGHRRANESGIVHTP